MKLNREQIQKLTSKTDLDVDLSKALSKKTLDKVKKLDFKNKKK